MNENTFKPHKSYIQVVPVEQDQVSKGGIRLPDTFRKTIGRGEIVSSGVDGYHAGETLIYKIGNVGTSIEIKIEDVSYTLVHEDSILGAVILPRPKRLDSRTSAASTSWMS